MKPGEISPVIEFQGQHWILKCEGHTEQVVTDPKEVWDDLYAQVTEEKTQLAVANTFTEIKDRAEIHNYLDRTSSTPSGKATTAKPAPTAGAKAPVKPVSGTRTAPVGLRLRKSRIRSVSFEGGLERLTLNPSPGGEESQQLTPAICQPRTKNQELPQLQLQPSTSSPQRIGCCLQGQCVVFWYRVCMPARFEHSLTVTEADLDRQGHVNNIVYIRWMQDAAVAHSAAQGGRCSAMRMRESPGSFDRITSSTGSPRSRR